MSENQYWVLDFDPADHLLDMNTKAVEGQIACIVDEEAGGIIAYVIGAGNTNLIVDKLNGEVEYRPSGRYGDEHASTDRHAPG